jgi:hypothetical protein
MAATKVRQNIYVFLYLCEKCHRPITACVVSPQPGGPTLEEAAEKKFFLHCHNFGECGWSAQTKGSAALQSWTADGSYET